MLAFKLITNSFFFRVESGFLKSIQFNYETIKLNVIIMSSDLNIRLYFF